ncbi:hypothetical protein F3Y22_tig00005294pilonHSYRG00136 [Hibiscus syriacus]|uniref:Uncharacterized protein n=1 Tax=Hibiscus syriacus TaxID=106335 RepID=A0A6A3CGJ4_HIBSY|nr:hypothetical protein F3Y22_tig00005294pilonHSYRG00136 [Hibiscus syriacus]
MRAMQLKEEITLIQNGNRSIPEYLHVVKALADEIALIDHPISDDDLTLYILNGLGSDFREIVAPIRAREKSLTFEELHDLLVGHDNYLRRLEAATQHLVVSANYTNRKQTSVNPSQKHHGKRSVTANCTSASHVTENKWLMDSTASHNITGDLNNLYIHSEYDGTDEVVLGDGSGQEHESDPTKRLYISRHVVFDEAQNPQTKQSSPSHSHQTPTQVLPSIPVVVPPVMPPIPTVSPADAPTMVTAPPGGTPLTKRHVRGMG